MAENGAMAGRERTDPICYVLKKDRIFFECLSCLFARSVYSFMRSIFEVKFVAAFSVLCVLQAVQSLEISF